MSNEVVENFLVGEFLVEPALGKITKNGESHLLRPREMDMLVYLSLHASAVVTTEDFIEHVWSGVFVTNDSVYFSLSQLRKALGDDSRAPTYIETIPKRGYRLIASVEAVSDASNAPAPQTPSIEIGPVSWLDKFPVRAALSAFVFLVIVGAGLVMGDFFRVERDLTESPVKLDASNLAASSNNYAQVADENTIAVMPFVDLSPNSDQSFFSDGISEELLFNLSRVKELKVAARTSSFSFKGGDPSIPDIGRALNVANILEGSVRTEGDTVRISAQLINAIDGFLIWSETYDRKLSSIFQVQDEISRAIVSALKLELTGLTSVGSKNANETDPDVYVKYLKGLDAYRKNGFESLLKAERLFEEVIASDPSFAKAITLLGKTKTTMYLTGVRRDPAAWTTARELAERSLELDPEDAQTYAYLGVLLGKLGEPAESMRMLRKALEISPSNSLAKAELALRHSMRGETDDARRLFDEALKADPFNEEVLLHHAAFNVQMGHSEIALDSYRRARKSNPANSNIPFHIGRELIEQYGDLSAGVSNYTLATQLDARDHELAAFLTLALLWTEAPERANVALENALSKNVDSGLVAAANALLLLTNGEKQKSVDLAIQTLKNDEFYNSHGSKEMLLRMALPGFLEQGKIAEGEQFIYLVNPDLEAKIKGAQASSWYEFFNSHKMNSNLTCMLILADLYKTAGRVEDLQNLLQKLEFAGYKGALEVRDKPRLKDYLIEAELAALRGNNEAAMDNLSTAIQGGYRTNWQLKIENNHAFAELRANPRFVALIQQIKSEAASHRATLVQSREA